MSKQRENIFVAFSETCLEKSSKRGMKSKFDSMDDMDERKVNLRPPNDPHETGLRRSNRSNKGIAREMFDPSHIPYHGRKSLPPPTKYVKEVSPEPEPPKQKKPKITPKKTKKEDSDSESGGENCNDSKKLWCICKKPHNGRFMISCDVCEEWFHGDCVGISIQRGKQMEKKGEEYICPKCKEKDKKQKSGDKTEKPVAKKDVVKQKSGVKLKGYAHGTKTTPEPQLESRKCIASSCTNKAPPGSIYCSNVCILRHAKESLASKNTKPKKESKPREETKDERIVRKIKEASSRGKVAVMCMKTGKIFANASAPLVNELENFLKKNPSFQKLKVPKTYKEKMPAKEQKAKEVTKQKSSENNTQSEPSKSSGGKYAEDPDYNPQEKQFSNPYKQYTPISPRNEGVPKKHKLPPLQDSGEPKKAKHKSESDRKSSLERPMKISSKRENRNQSDERSLKKEDNVVRKNVQKSLLGILQNRSNSSTDLKMHPDSISKLVAKVEDSLYKLFEGVNSKYKNRYRSIMFNLKDEKNEGLWRKVILGEVSSSRLVKMTPEEMASKELAQWRKHELKQELEMIQELEVANQAVRPVAKITHKGEIVINEDYSDLTESHLNSSADKSQPTIAPQRVRRTSASQPEVLAETSPLPQDTTSQHNNHLFDLNCMICTGQIKEEDANLEDGAKKVRRSTSIILSNEAAAPVEETDEEIIEKINAYSKKSEKSSNHHNKEDEVNNGGDRSSKTPEYEDVEPSSSSAIATPEPVKRGSRKPSWDNFLWTGVISMPELSNFRSNAYAASGNSKDLVNCIPQKLAMDGRIHPKVVWDYLAKVRNFSNKEVCVIQFHAASEEDRVGYVAMLSYFSSRKRFGVVSNQNTQIVKDIYIAPLLENEDVPRQLQPLHGPGIPSDHPSLLIGIIVKCVVENKRQIIDIDKSFARISGIDQSKKRSISNEFLFPEKKPLQPLMPVNELTSKIEENAPYSPEDEVDEDDEEYNPETADFGENVASAPVEDDEEAYDPEKLVFDDNSNREDDAPYDPEDDAERFETSEVKALQEKQAFLEKMKQELEMKKAELAQEEMTLQIQQTTQPPAVSQPKKVASQPRVDPRVAARMQKSKPAAPAPSENADSPLQTIFSVLNIDRIGNA